MDHRFSRRLPGVAAIISFSVSLAAAAPAFSSEDLTRVPSYRAQANGTSPTEVPQPLSPSGSQFMAAVVLPPGMQSAALDNTPRRLAEDDEALLRGLVHSSRGMDALATGDRAKAQEELEISTDILLKLPEAANSGALRLQLIEETARLKAALSGVSSDHDPDSRASGQDEQDEQDEEDEADTEAVPDLVTSEEEPRLTLPDSEIVSMPELDADSFDVPIVLNEQVKAYIQYYQTRKWGVMSRAFERSGRYLPMMRQIFMEYGLPLDLVNLAYIESAFNSRAYSSAKASGIWQFIKATGNRYGMKVNHWLDERRDPEKATRAAAGYLKDLYEMFHSWPLAMAAYNAGEHRVQRAIEQQDTTDFWSLKLPNETKLYVPAFMAITIISKDPNRYGFAAPVEEPWKVERATVPGAIELRSIARVVGVSPDVIRDLNPALMRGMTPVTSTEQVINLPPGTKEVLLANLDRLPRVPARAMAQAAGRRHRVGKGESLKSVALQHHTTAAELAALNGLRTDNGLKVGAVLRLPPAKLSGGRTVTTARPAGPASGVTRGSEAIVSTRSVAHIVKRGETLFGIARAYAVTPEELRRWNAADLKGQTTLRSGQTLRVRSGQALQQDSGQAPQVVARAAKSSQIVRRNASGPTAQSLYHRVRRGDTLWQIARVHDVTPDELRRWNDLGRQVKLHVGQELMIRPSKS